MLSRIFFIFSGETVLGGGGRRNKNAELDDVRVQTINFANFILTVPWRVALAYVVQ